MHKTKDIYTTTTSNLTVTVKMSPGILHEKLHIQAV